MVKKLVPFEHQISKSRSIDDVFYIRVSSFDDNRGALWSVWSKDWDGLPDLNFNLDKVSVSKKNVLRGMHGDQKSWKFITVLSGEVFFALADIRSSESNGAFNCESMTLNADDKKAILVPPGVLNGFHVLSEEAVFFYKWSFKGEYVDASEQLSVKWYDERLCIDWKCTKPIVSERDR